MCGEGLVAWELPSNHCNLWQQIVGMFGSTYAAAMTSLPAPRNFSSAAAWGAAYDHGAHVVEWTPTGHSPVLWMSARSSFDSAAPIRGGIPVCFPWFGTGRDGKQAPAHGFARLSSWQLLDEERSDTGTRANYALDITPSVSFPHNVHAELLIDFGSDLGIEFSVHNFGEHEFSFEEALHTYLTVGDITQLRITGLDGTTYLDKAPGAAPEPVTQAGDVTFSGETDRVYSSSADVTIVDPVLGRSITITRSNSANLVVWNPWVAKSAAMPDFGDEEWPGMVCVEGANVLDHAIVLQPGDSHTMTYGLRVGEL